MHDYLQRKGIGKLRQVGHNVMGCCPFHNDDRPSFGVDDETGTYNCFGCGAKGSFSALVKRMDGFDTIFDAEMFLITTYGRYQTTVDQPLDISFEDDVCVSNPEIDEGILNKYHVSHPYLTNRGVSERWQRVFEVGYNRNTRSVTFPYRDERGRLITVKHRRIVGKSFWYEPPLPPRTKAETLYALHHVLTSKVDKVAITEAEIDCISVWQAGIGAVAIGGNQFTNEQTAKIIRYLSPETEIIVFTDNDEGGRLARQRIVQALSGRFLLSEVDWTSITHPVKDANDVTENEIRRLITSRKPVGLCLNVS